MKRGIRKQVLGIVLSLGLVAGSAAVPVQAAQLSDVKGHWAETYINTLVEAGGIGGYPDGTFRPDDTISKAEFISILLGVTGNKPEINGDWMTSVLKKAYDTGLYTYGGDWGYDNMAGDPIYREDVAVLLVSAAENLRHETVPYNELWESDQVIPDISTANPYYGRPSIESCYAMGLMTGDDKGNFHPLDLLTRAEATVAVCRLIEAVDRTPVTIPVVKQTAQYQPLPDGSNVGESGAVYPYEGATDINTGKTITRDPVTGVLGFGNGQKGNIYYGVDIVKFDGTKTKIKDGTFAVDDYDNFRTSDVYTRKHGYCFWDSEWFEIEMAAREKLPMPDASMLGKKADIYGNVIADNDTTTEAFWEVRPAFDVYLWTEIEAN